MLNLYSVIKYLIQIIWREFPQYKSDFLTSYRLARASRKVLLTFIDTTREDIEAYHLNEFLHRIVSIYTVIVGYHDSISKLCISGHSVNAWALLRIQLEAYILLCYLSDKKLEIEDIKKRAREYEEWVAVYSNTQVSKECILFKIYYEEAIL